jgi:CBS domain-containing protein
MGNRSREVSIDLDVEQSRTTKKPQQILRLVVASVHAYTRDGGAPTITRDCTDVEALEREADRLKGEIDTAVEKARGMASKAHAAAAAPTAGSAKFSDAAINTKPHLASDFRVRDVMTTDVRTINSNDSLSVADELMNVGRFRHVAVIDETGALVGVVSRRDIFHGALSWSLGQGRTAYEKLLETTPVKQVMETSVFTVGPDTPLPEAAARMIAEKVGCLPVVDAENLVGILTEGDFLALLTAQH